MTSAHLTWALLTTGVALWALPVDRQPRALAGAADGLRGRRPRRALLRAPFGRARRMTYQGAPRPALSHIPITTKEES